MRTPTQTDWARLAMAIDCEGCVDITLRQRKERIWRWQAFDICLKISNTDIRLPNWCRERFGGKVGLVYPENYRKNHRACFAWQVYGKACEEIFKGILPHSIIKKEQIEIGLAYTATMRDYRGRRKPVPQEMKLERHRAFSALRSIKDGDRAA